MSPTRCVQYERKYCAGCGDEVRFGLKKVVFRIEYLNVAKLNVAVLFPEFVAETINLVLAEAHGVTLDATRCPHIISIDEGIRLGKNFSQKRIWISRTDSGVRLGCGNAGFCADLLGCAKLNCLSFSDDRAFEGTHNP